VRSFKCVGVTISPNPNLRLIVDAERRLDSKLDPVSQDHRLAEGQPRFGAVPVDEVVDGMSIGPLVEAAEPSVFSTVRFAWSRSLRRRTFFAARVVFDLHRIFGVSFRMAASTAADRDLC
jgi:hypothetical protein